MFFTASPTHRYYYEQHGAGPPLLLLHGFTACTSNWSPLVEALAPKYTVITLDLPGHGRSTAPSDPAAYAMPAVARHINALLDHLHHPTPHLLGYSMGGRLALYMALHFPHRWRSLILESASPGLAQSSQREARVRQDEALAAFIEQQGIEAFVARWQALPLFATQKNLPPATQETHRALRLQNNPHGLANSLRGMGTGVQPSLWHQLPQLALPTLLIAGALDHKFVTIAGQMHRLLPDSQLVVVPHAGHTVHLEQSQAYAHLIGQWLQQIESGSPPSTTGGSSVADNSVQPHP